MSDKDNKDNIIYCTKSGRVVRSIIGAEKFNIMDV